MENSFRRMRKLWATPWKFPPRESRSPLQFVSRGMKRRSRIFSTRPGCPPSPSKPTPRNLSDSRSLRLAMPGFGLGAHCPVLVRELHHLRELIERDRLRHVGIRAELVCALDIQFLSR